MKKKAISLLLAVLLLLSLFPASALAAENSSPVSTETTVQENETDAQQQTSSETETGAEPTAEPSAEPVQENTVQKDGASPACAITVNADAPTTAEMTAGTAYMLDLSTVFTDSEGHAMTYALDKDYGTQVYIKDDGTFVFNTSTAGTYTPTITATCTTNPSVTASYMITITVKAAEQGGDNQYSYDEMSASSVTVYVTISSDGTPILGADGTPLAGLKVTVPYFDLSLYGLENYYRYGTENGSGGYTNTTVVQRPTALHLYIYLLERYYLGLFGYVKGADLSSPAVIRNVTVDGSVTLTFLSYTGDAYAAGLCGYADCVSISDCVNKASVSLGQNWNYAGGIAGFCTDGTTITDCGNEGSISGFQYIGGIAGSVRYGTQIEGCFNSGSVSSGNAYAGGICGEVSSTSNSTYGISSLVNCYSVGTVTGGGGYVGGIVGRLVAGGQTYRMNKISNCFATGTVTGADPYVGAAIGNVTSADAVVENVYYLTGAAASGIGTDTGSHTTTAMTAEELAADTFATTLNTNAGKTAFQAGVTTPVMAWQPAPNRAPVLKDGVSAEAEAQVQTGTAYLLTDLQAGKIFEDPDGDSLNYKSYSYERSTDGGVTWSGKMDFSEAVFGATTISLTETTAGTYIYRFYASDGTDTSTETWTLTLQVVDAGLWDTSFYVGQDQNYSANGNVYPIIRLYKTAGVDTETGRDYVGQFTADGQTIYVFDPADYTITSNTESSTGWYVAYQSTQYELSGYEPVTFTDSTFGKDTANGTASGSVVSSYNMFYAAILSGTYSYRAYGYNTATQDYTVRLGGMCLKIPTDTNVDGSRGGGTDIYLRLQPVGTSSLKSGTSGDYFDKDSYYTQVVCPIMGCTTSAGDPYGQSVTLRLQKTAGAVTYYQDYELTIARIRHLASLSAALDGTELVTTNASGTVIGFDRDVTDYYVSVQNDTTALTLNASYINGSGDTNCCGGYYVTVNGERYETLENTSIVLDTAQSAQTFVIQVCHEDAQGTDTAYTLHVIKTAPVYVTFSVTPADAVVFLTNNSTGVRVWPGGNTFALTPGASYTYTVTAEGYVGQQNSVYTAPDADTAVTVALNAATDENLPELSADWPSFRADDDNNGVISALTPTSSDETVLYWATKVGDGYSADACGCPIIVDGYLYTYAGDTVYKVDRTSGKIVASGQMDHASSYAINSPTYADGMLFIGLSDGTVQAFDASTLESLWIYHDALGGQPNCPITYHDGYIYTGFWQGESLNANYVCLSVTDEDPASQKEEKLASWTYTSRGGFYWAGAYVSDGYLLVGTDDGAAGYSTGYASLLSLDPRTGKLLDSVQMPNTGDIRCSIVRDASTGWFYFTSKGGYFYGISVGDGGTLGTLRSLRLTNSGSGTAMSTSTPTVYNGRAYIGVCGASQFGPYSGHNITVLDLKNWEIAYTVQTQGYPQTSGILTTAYDEGDGTVYVYFFDNYTPGKLRVLRDKPGQTEASLVTQESYTSAGSTTTYTTAYALFTPDGEQAQYAICSPVVDSDGTIYFKNDSGYLMAVGSTIDSLTVTAQPDKTEYKAGETFDPTGMKVEALFANGVTRDVTDYITWSDEPLTADDTDFQLIYDLVKYHNENGAAGVLYTAPIAVLPLTVSGGTFATGDVNGDGSVNALDAAIAYAYHNGRYSLTDDQLVRADVNGDGSVNALDAAMIYAYHNGKLAGFPADDG